MFAEPLHTATRARPALVQAACQPVSQATSATRGPYRPDRTQQSCVLAVGVVHKAENITPSPPPGRG